jgi:hypothetical protein
LAIQASRTRASIVVRVQKTGVRYSNEP